MHALILVDHHLHETPVAYAPATNLVGALLDLADRLFGRGRYRLWPDRTAAGRYAASADGRCLLVRAA